MGGGRGEEEKGRRDWRVRGGRGEERKRGWDWRVGGGSKIERERHLRFIYSEKE